MRFVPVEFLLIRVSRVRAPGGAWRSLGTCIYAGFGAFFCAEKRGRLKKSDFPVEYAVQVGYATLACQYFVCHVEIAAGSVYVLMAHEVHKAVYVHLAVCAVLVYAVVRGEVVPELVRRKFKGQGIRQAGDEQLHGVACEWLAPAV